MKPSSEIGDLLALPARQGPALQRAAEKLAIPELNHAEQLEKLGQRRQGVLKVIFREKKRRAGKRLKMLRLEAGGNV